MAPYPAPPPPPPPPETDSIIDGLGASNAETEQEGAVALPSFGGAEQNGLYDEAPGPQPEEKKPWDKPLTIPEIRKSSTNWSLASDAGLLLYLQEFSQRLIAKTSNLEKEVDGLVNTAKSANTKVHNTFNDFLMLANTQFIENRVYDDSEEVEAPDSEEKDSKKDPQSKSREQREAEVIPRVIKALTLGVNVLDTAFEQLDANAGNSDSEEEDATYKSVDPILEPKDLYAHRALPYIIGTPAFMQDDDVGLADLYSEDEEEEEGSSASSSEEEESDLSESDYSVTASDSEEEAPRSKKGSQSASTAKSGASHEEQESDGDLFGSEQDESEDEDSEGQEKKKAKPKGSAFANELAAKIGAEPLGGGDDDEQATKERAVSEVSQGSEKVSKKDSKRKKKSKKHRSGSEISKTEDDNLFSQPDPEEEDSPFGRKGLFSTTGGGLFDNDDDGDGDLFDEAPADKTADHIYEAVSGADEPSSQKQRKKEKKPRSSSGLFEEDEDELFASTSSKKSEEPKKAKPVSKSDGGGLFADDDDDLFGAPQTKPAKKEEKMKAKSVDLFGEEDGDLFGDESQTQPSKVSEEKPKKKLPAGAVQMFGGANPLASKRQPSSSSSSSDDFEEPPEMASQPKPKPKPQEPTKAKPTDSETKKKQKDDLFDDDEDDLFSTPREEKDKKPKNRAAESLFDDLEGEGTEDDLFAATAKQKESTKKKPPGGVALFGGADLFGEKETEEEAGKSPTKEEPPPLQKAPNRNKTNTLSLFNDQFDGEGGDDTLFAAPSKQKAEEEEEPSEDKATRRRTKSKSIFADEDVLFGTNEDDPSVDLFGSSNPTQPNKPESPTSPSRESSAPKTKERSSSSRGLFSDEEEDDLFGGGGSTAKSKDDGDNLFGEEAPPSKPKEKPAAAAKEKKKKKVEVKEVTKKKTKKTTTGGGGLFGEDDDDGDDLFGEKSETTKEVEEEEAVEEDQSQAKEAEPVKRKKLAGAVSMFGGMDPTTIVKKRSSSSRSESEKEPSSPLSSPPSSKETPPAEHVSSKSPLHASPPLVTSPKPSKVPAKPAAKPAKAPIKTPPPLVSPSSPPPSSRISALQPRQFRKHAPFTRDYDPGIHTYHPDKPLPQIPQTSISRRNAGKFRSPSGSLSSSNRESTHSPPVPERVPQVQHPRSHSREQHLTPPKWRYVENGRRYHLEEDYGGKDVGSHCHQGGASYSKDPSSPLPMRHYDIYESYLVNSDAAPYVEFRSPCEREFLSDQDVLTDQARWTQRKRRNRSRERKPVPMKRNGLLAPDWEESGSGPTLIPKAPLTANNSSDIEVWDRPPPPLPKPRTLHSNNVSRHPNQSDHRQDSGNCVVRRKKSYKHAPLKLSYSGDSDSSTSSETSLAFHSADVASPYNQRRVLRCASPPKSLPLKSRCMENRCQSPYQLSPLSETQPLDSPDSPRKLKCQISSPFHPRHGVFDDSYFNDRAKAKRNSPTDPNHCLTPPPRPPKPPSLSPTSDDYRTIESSFGHASKESPLNPPQVKPRSFPNKSHQVGKEIPPHPKPPKPKNEGSDLSKFLTKKPHESIVSMCFERIPPEGRSIKKMMNGNHIPEDSNLEYRDLPILPEFLNPVDERHLKVSYSSTSSSGYASSDWSIGRSDLRQQNSIASILSDHHGNGEQKHSTPKSQIGSVPSSAVRLRNPSMVVSEVGPSHDQQSRPAGSGRARKPCRETFLLKKSLFESLSGGLSGSSMLKPTGFDEPFPRIGLSPNRISSKQEHSLSPVGEYPSPPSSKKKKQPPQVAPKPRSRKLNGMDERLVPEQRNKENHRHAGTTRIQGDSYKANLAINPSALKPGAAPPVKEDAPREVGFDVPVSANTLTSLQKQRARPTGKRRLPSRRKTGTHSNPSLFGEVEDTADIGGAVGGLDIPDTSIDFHLPDPSPPPILSRSPPVWRSVAPPTSSGKTRSQDLFGNDDLFGDEKESDGFDSSPGARPKIKSETVTGSDIFSDSNKPPAEDPLSLGGSSEISSGSQDSENSSNRKAKTKQPAEEPVDGDGDLFAEVPPTTVKPRVGSIVMDDEDDLFGEKSKSKKEPLSPSLDVDDDLFASSSISPPPPEKSVPDDDLFGESSGAKPKKKTTAKVAAAVEDDDDDLFAAKPASKKKAKGKKVKPDSDLFADTTDIFADLPASKPKTKKTKKNADLFKNTGGDDIFSSDSSGTPAKTKKKAKKKTDKKQVSDSIFDTSAPSIFDDPLNATKTE